jgi:AraC-like DNA-binding protein
MRNIPLSTVDGVDRPLLAIATDYPAGTLLDTHSHRRAQFLYGATGSMEVGTDDGAWVVPPSCGVWIPAGKPHRVRMLGVSTRSLYIEPRAAPRAALQCEVLPVSPLLRQLLLDSAGLPAEYERRGRDAALVQLIVHELQRAPTLPFFAPMPRDAALAALCARFLHRPDVHASPADWAQQLHRSERGFTRFFRLQTGMSFGEWRQQACLLAALSRLSLGDAVTTVALDLGYESPGAFSTMFRKRLGIPPSAFLRA